MYVASKPGGGTYLIPDEFRTQFTALGFTRFDEPPRGTPLVTEPVEFDPNTVSAAASAGDRIVTDQSSGAATENIRRGPGRPAKAGRR